MTGTHNQTATYMDYSQGSPRTSTQSDLGQHLNNLMQAARNNPQMMSNYQTIGQLMNQMGEYGIKVFANGNQVDFSTMGVQPMIREGRTLMPVRALMAALGGQVNWDPSTQTVTATNGNTTISMQIGAGNMLVNGQPVSLDAPATIVNGRTMLPLRAMAQAMGMNVNWYGQSDMVVLTSK